MILIDGRSGEGGGQILRSSLALSATTGTPFRITHVRANRKRPGLMRQHLTAVHAATEVCDAHVEGAAIGSSSVTFEPGPARAGEYTFAVGTAGSTMLVLQTVLPPLLLADAPSRIHLSGGTHNPFAPPFTFLHRTFAPMVERMGGKLSLELLRPGFYPAGGGEVVVTIEPAHAPRALDLTERGEARRHTAELALAHLDPGILDREWDAVQRVLFWTRDARVDLDATESRGPGNVLSLILAFENVTEVVTGFGAKGVPAEKIARRAAQIAKRFLGRDEPVGEHLADQLLVPMALLAGGRFETVEPSSHTHTNVDIVHAFLPDRIQLEHKGAGSWTCSVAT